MEDFAAAHSSFVIERGYPQAPERVFAAFADQLDPRGFAALEGWLSAHRTKLAASLDRLGTLLAEAHGSENS